MPPGVLLDIYKPSHNDRTVRLLIYYSFFLYILHILLGVQITGDLGLVLLQSPVIIIIGVHFLILIEVLAWQGTLYTLAKPSKLIISHL